ncbi:MAG: RidA family protein [Bacteroidetes bacterium]|nr:RidA family protein [Bacteroidota bacterium]MBL0017297.1 RidA family protein [Bacteroidota bacterium]MBP6638874.1 RidA family protein [Bacteroidia bacterium]MBP6721012.1 RidA family protein [Bacteroidia bacterium]MBP8073807.1 RidA family protein [Bacteroidia bacterium]
MSANDESIRISSGAPWEDIVGYSRAVRKGNMIWVSGTAPMKDGLVVGIDDPYRQAVMCFRIIKNAIEASGGKMSDVVRTRMYLTRIRDWEHVARAHAEFFGSVRPATTLVQVAKLIDPNILVEIEADAMLD